MPTVNKNTPLLHRKEFQLMTPAPAATVAGAFVIASYSGNFNNAMMIRSATEHYFYNHDEDAFLQVPSGALAGTFGAGACGVFHPWSINYTANGGSTTSVTVAAGTHNITGRAVGQTIEFISAGSSSGFRTTVASILNNAGAGTITLNLTDAAPAAIANAHTFRITTGRFYVMSAGTIAAGIFKVFDVATMAWQANLGTTNLPATWGTDGKLVVAYNFGESYATGTATAGGASTLTNSGKAWTTNQWTNYQIRITAGTGIGQIRTIASNTGTVITTSAAWTTQPDATSQYIIEANEDFLYLMGNNAVTMYRYSISANTWTVMAPTTARAAAVQMVGSWKHESGLDPCQKRGDGGVAWGLNSWHPGRRFDMPENLRAQIVWAITVELPRDCPECYQIIVQSPNAGVSTVRAAIQKTTRWGVLGNRWVYADELNNILP